MTSERVAGLLRPVPFLVTFAVLAAAVSVGWASPPEPPPAKRTTVGLYLTADEAHDMWRADSTAVTVLDVRTPEEYLLIGHAPMAWNVPLAFLAPEWEEGEYRQSMRGNPEFVARVEALAGRDDVLLVMCRSGARSAKAVDLLAAAGFTRVYSVVDGFEGDKVKDPASAFHGMRMVNGWRNRGLPWTYGYDPGRIRVEEQDLTETGSPD